MEIRSLDTIEKSALIDCFLKVFEDYFVKMPIEHDYYVDRWRKAKVDYSLSFGMFDDDKLVGFIINAVDERNGKLIAFNTGSGVLPKNRGYRIIKSLYQHAFPLLENAGIEECRLEVIQENSKAIKSYESVGFSITKNYQGFAGTLNIDQPITDYKLKSVQGTELDWGSLNQNNYSWDNHKNVLLRGDHKYYLLSKMDATLAYFIIDPESGYLSQFNVIQHGSSGWRRLFYAIQSISRNIRINNVDTSLHTKMAAINELGLTKIFQQYEMSIAMTK